MTSFANMCFVFRNAKIVFTVMALMIFQVGKAQAVTIDCDDLEPGSFLTGDCFDPPTNKLDSFGIEISGCIEPLATSAVSSPNVLWGPLGFTIYFLDEIPTYVSMYVGSLQEYKVFVRADTESGYFEYKNSEGGVRGMEWETSTPYTPNQFISLFIPEGITSITVSGQADVYIDDFTFSASVPEPSSFLLLLLGMLVTYLHRKRPQ